MTGSTRRGRSAARAWFALVAMLALACAGCRPKPRAIAELARADGPAGTFQRQEGGGAWAAAATGAKFFMKDAARTGVGTAQLQITGTPQQIAMRPNTVLRFGGGKSGASKITVEVGAIEVTGAGTLALDIGDIRLDGKGSVRVTPKNVELLAGGAKVSTFEGQVLDLTLGQTLEMDVGKIKVMTIDAGVADAPAPADAGVADAPIDAAEAADAVAIELTAGKAEIQAPGETKWAPLPADQKTLDKGTKLRLGAGGHAKLTSGTTSVDLDPNARLTVADDLLLGLELGTATARVPVAAAGKVSVPGGAVELAGSPQTGAEAAVTVSARGETTVAVRRGSAKLAGAAGNTLDLAAGEEAAIAKAGTLHVTAQIPTFYDMAINAGDTAFTIHDAKGATAMQFNFDQCAGGGVIEMDHDTRFKAPKRSPGKGSAKLMITPGSWAYRLRCTNGDTDGPAVAHGQIALDRNSGERPLPKAPPTNTITANGFKYSISYQSQIPNLKVSYVGSGTHFVLHLATGGVDKAIESTKPAFDIASTDLKEGNYTFYVEHDGVKQDKVSQLAISFDQQTPQVYIESPRNGQPFGSDILVAGAVLPGWTAKIDDVEIRIDKNTRRFQAKVGPPAGKALAIKLQHPKRGVHYYLRRGA